MEFIFHEEVAQAEKEFDDCLTEKHFEKLSHVYAVIDSVGFYNVPEHLIKHLWNDVYELRLLDGRVIFVVAHTNESYVIGAYIKKTQKMPGKIQRTLKQREKDLLNALAGEKLWPEQLLEIN